MPPRLETLQRLGTVSLCLRPATRPATPNFLPIVQTANLSQREKRRKAKQDPYAWAQAQQRKNANIKRKEEIAQEKRGEGWNDPVNGRVTPFIESLDSAGQARYSKVRVGPDGNPLSEPRELPQTKGMRNFFLTEEEFDDVTKQAYELTRPIVGVVQSQVESISEEDQLEIHEKNHARAVEAMKRITALENGSSKHRYHANVQRIIEEFGRHKTDKILKPKAQSVYASTEAQPTRGGPDTGSSEVQIAILTAKIRSLSQALKINRGYKDKHNTRNLELLVHRRQKLLRYMERRERGSERWTHMLEKLGITEAAWKGQVTSLSK
ncbi:hypothetical protein ACO1O0_006233 [Amphichorda felina]